MSSRLWLTLLVCELQVHYLQARPKGDESGVRLHMGSRPTPFAAGMINYASYFTIPPGKAEHPIENQCCYSGFEVLKGFAFRVHTHAMGRLVLAIQRLNCQCLSSVCLTVHGLQSMLCTQSLFVTVQNLAQTKLWLILPQQSGLQCPDLWPFFFRHVLL